jgi:hypothetical protein
MFTILLPYVFSKVDQDGIKEGSRFTPYNNILVGKHRNNFGFICVTNNKWNRAGYAY